MSLSLWLFSMTARSAGDRKRKNRVAWTSEVNYSSTQAGSLPLSAHMIAALGSQAIYTQGGEKYVHPNVILFFNNKEDTAVTYQGLFRFNDYYFG